MQFDVYSRALIPSHFYRMKVLAWQCSVCCKIFCRSLDEVERARTDETPLYIEREFRMHSCELVLVNCQKRRDARRPVRVSIDLWDATRHDG